MNRLGFCSVIVSILMTCPLVAMFQFDDLNTKRTLSVVPGTLQDWDIAKEFCLNFFKATYDQIPPDQKEFSTIEELINKKFSKHYQRVFVDKKYTFFVLKDEDTFVGYSIFDVIDRDVFVIEAQANIVRYSFHSLLEGLSRFVKKEFAPDSQCFLWAARKILTETYWPLFRDCKFNLVDNLHPNLATPRDYYGDPSWPISLAEYYQGYELNLNSI